MKRTELRNITMRMDAALRDELVASAEKEQLTLTAFTQRMIRKGLSEFKRTGAL